MKRLLLLILIACLCVPMISATAYHENFQSFSFTGDGLSYSTSPPISIADATTGRVLITLSKTGTTSLTLGTTSPSQFSYLAFDDEQSGDGGSVLGIQLYDSSMALLSTVYTPQGAFSNSRVELKIVGMSPTVFLNGVQRSNGSVISIYPTYVTLVPGNVVPTNPCTTKIDNIVFGGTDHHVVGALPTNWSVIKDFISPASTGMFAWSGSAWVSKNSNSFYIDADTDSTDAIYTENLIIENSAGTIINTTPIDSTVPLHTIQYNITQFLSDAATLGGLNTYGQYSVHFEGSGIYDYFWVLGSGASVTWGSKNYNQGDTGAVVYYTTTGGYWDTSTYSYKLNIISANDGSVKQSTPILASSGTVTYAFKTTDNQGVYYAALIATRLSDGTQIWMNYDYTTLTAYVVFTGFVKDAQTALPIAGASVNMTQGSTTLNSTTGFDGNYTSAQFITGANIFMNTTKTGYDPYFHQVVPLRTGTIALNITLMPSSPAYTGITLGGIAREPPYNRTIDGATVTIGNTTAPYGNYSVTTNSAGYYQQTTMPNNYFWDIIGSKLGYINSVTYRKLVMGV